MVILGSVATTAAQDKRPIRANDLYRLQTASDVALSPDARWLAYTVTQIDSADNAYYSHIWIADLDGATRRQLTRGKVRDRAPAWSPDGSRVAFVSDRAGERSQIFLIRVDGGEARQLTRIERGATDPVWSPEGRRILLSSALTTGELERDEAGTLAQASLSGSGAADAGAMYGSLSAIRNWLAQNAEQNEPAVITRLNFQGERQLQPREEWSHLFLLDLESDEVRRVTRGAFDFEDASFAPDGRRVVFTAAITEGYHPDYAVKRDLYILDLATEVWRKVNVPGYSVSNPAWSPAGGHIAFTARDTTEPSASNTLVGVIGVIGIGEEPGDRSIVWPNQALDRSARGFRWSQDGQTIYFSAAVHGTVPIYRARLQDGQIRQLVSGERGALSFDLRRDRIAYVITEPANPSEVYVADADGAGERRISALNADWLQAVQLQPHRSFHYPSFDGRRIEGWLIEPVGYQPGRKYPLAVEIHGGPHAMWGPGERTMWLEFQFLAAHGYTVLYTNPRGSDGYGYQFKYSIQRDWGDGPMRDVLTAVDTVVGRGAVDADRMVVTGGSYAGYLTAYLVGHDHRFKAAIAQRGVYDLATFFGEGNAWRLIPYEFDAYPWEDFETLRAQSPITYAHQIQTPLLIMHSDRDLRTGVSQSEMLYRTLAVLKKPVEYVRYPREGHDLSRTGEPKLRIDRLLRILEFFERHIGDRD